MERHGELQMEREKLERARAGVSTAFIASMLRADGKWFESWDVFPELRDDEPDEDDDAPPYVGGDPAIVMARIQALAARERMIAEA